MQAIRTRFLGATNTRAARIVARCEARSITIPWDYSLGIEANHVNARNALCERLGWTDPMETGFLNGDGYHVFRNQGMVYTLQEIRDGTGFDTNAKFEAL